MRAGFSLVSDPMIAVLIVACGLGIILPTGGEVLAGAQAVSNGAIFVLFLVNGMRIARGDLVAAVANWRFFLPMFLWVFGVMPLMGFGVSLAAGLVLPAMVAMGFVFLGALPSTVQSATSYTSLAGGNVALSVVGAALINIAGVFVSAPLFAFLVGGEGVDIGTDAITRVAVILILPFLIGQLLQGWTIAWLRERKASLAWLDRGVIGIAVFVAISGATQQGLGAALGPVEWTVLTGLVVGLLAVSTIGAWLAGVVIRLRYEDRIAFMFAGAQKSVAIGAPIAAILFTPDIAGFVIAPLLLYHLLQLVIATPIARLLARHHGFR